MWKALRVVILLFILATVAQAAWLAKRDASDWNNPLIVVIYPINADGSDAAERYIGALGVQRFQPIEQFMREQAAVYALPLAQPVELRLSPRINSLPPPTPDAGNVPAIVLWSLRLRFWAWWNDTYPGARANVRLFLLYHDDRTSPRLAHSTGLQKGLIGVVNVFATAQMSAENNVVIAHEMLHTLGATDKYDLRNTLPLYPDGYAEPELVPRLPQRFAEIMAGRIPLTPVRAEQVEGLHQVVIGPKTAAEINWLRP
jgi:hypothetical protein